MKYAAILFVVFSSLQAQDIEEIPKPLSLVRSVPVDFFELFVEMSNGYLILDIYADWCGPCQKMKPTLDALSLEYANVRFMQLNKDDAKDICKKYKVNFLPTLIFFKDGKEVGRSKGYMNLEAAQAKIYEIFGF